MVGASIMRSQAQQDKEGVGGDGWLKQGKGEEVHMELMFLGTVIRLSQSYLYTVHI